MKEIKNGSINLVGLIRPLKPAQYVFHTHDQKSYSIDQTLDERLIKDHLGKMVKIKAIPIGKNALAITKVKPKKYLSL